MQKRGQKKELSRSEQFAINHPKISKKIKSTLTSSIVEGGFATASGSFGASYFTPYALALNATSSQIGWLNSLIMFLPNLIQLQTTRLIEKFSRKKIVIWALLLQSLIILPLILISLFSTLQVKYVVWVAIILMVLFYSIAAPSTPAWFSWLGSIVPEEHRGEYFSKRNRICGLVGVFSMIAAALLLDYSKNLGYLFLGFGVLFSIAFITRIITLFLFNKHYEPKLVVKKADYFSLWQFLKRAKQTPFGRFTIYSAIQRTFIAIASPFFAVYLLKNLELSYVWFMAITVSGLLFQFLFYPTLGEATDKFGNIKILRICSFFLALVPLLWLISPNPFYLIAIPSLVSGFGWAGLNLTSSNYIYDSVKQEKRSYGITYYNFLVGIGSAIGAGIGAVLALLSFSLMSTMLLIFLVSGVTRLLFYVISEGWLREVRHVKHFKYQYLIKEIIPSQGIRREVHKLDHASAKLIHSA